MLTLRGKAPSGHKPAERSRFSTRGPPRSAQTPLFNEPLKDPSALKRARGVRSPRVSDPTQPDDACLRRPLAQQRVR